MHVHCVSFVFALNLECQGNRVLNSSNFDLLKVKSVLMLV